MPIGEQQHDGQREYSESTRRDQVYIQGALLFAQRNMVCFHYPALNKLEYHYGRVLDELEKAEWHGFGIEFKAKDAIDEHIET